MIFEKKKQNTSPLHPIEVTTRVNFQHRSQLSFIEQMNQIGDAACKLR